MTSSDMTNGICAPGSADGPLPSSGPDMPSSVEYFQSLRPANLTARQARDLELLTSGTYGPQPTTSSDICALESSLVNKFQASWPSNGGTLYRTTFKRRDMSPQRSIPAWRSGADRTSGNGFTGWPTPREADGEKNVRSAAGSAREVERKGGPQDMSGAATLSGWPTPIAGIAHKLDALPHTIEKRIAQGRELGTAMVARMTSSHGWSEETLRLAGCPTPRAADTTGAGQSGEGGPNLRTVATLPYGPIRYTVLGEMRTGCSAQMVSGGQLNPSLPRWLMAFPVEWERSAPGWSSWQFWQVLTQAASEMPSDTE